jgi:hypothetical protein
MASIGWMLSGCASVQEPVQIPLTARAPTPEELTRAPQANWIALIREQLGLYCAFQVAGIEAEAIGNNGYMLQQWNVSTCHGDKKYRAEYFPPAAFPVRTTPYSVEPIAE